MNDISILYPKIHVYHDMFDEIKDINIKSVLEESKNNPEDSLIKAWRPWYTFGDISDGYNLYWFAEKKDFCRTLDGNLFNFQNMSDKNIKELKLIQKIIDNFWEVIGKYTNYYNFVIPEDWKMDGPSLAMYEPNQGINEDIAMHYHTDYQYDKHNYKGKKFIITCTMYLNDDYEGGEISFVPKQGIEINYKPKFGDVIIFPSGHPDYFKTEENSLYLHGVKSIKNGQKYFVRTYLTKYQEETQYWKDGVEQYGEQLWIEMMEKESAKKRDELSKIRFTLGYH